MLSLPIDHREHAPLTQSREAQALVGKFGAQLLSAVFCDDNDITPKNVKNTFIELANPDEEQLQDIAVHPRGEQTCIARISKSASEIEGDMLFDLPPKGASAPIIDATPTPRYEYSKGCFSTRDLVNGLPAQLLGPLPSFDATPTPQPKASEAVFFAAASSSAVGEGTSFETSFSAKSCDEASSTPHEVFEKRISIKNTFIDDIIDDAETCDNERKDLHQLGAKTCTARLDAVNSGFGMQAELLPIRAASLPNKAWCDIEDGTPTPYPSAGQPSFAMGAVPVPQSAAELGRLLLGAALENPKDVLAADASEAAVSASNAPTIGSRFHGQLDEKGLPRCEPCAWFWKRDEAGQRVGCQNGRNCVRCHLCEEGEPKRRKKDKIERMKAAQSQSKPEGNGRGGNALASGKKDKKGPKAAASKKSYMSSEVGMPNSAMTPSYFMPQHGMMLPMFPMFLPLSPTLAG